MIHLKHSSRNQRHARDRRGQSLILIFFTLIALIGVLALTLDYGFILLARRQMQTGVNAAALEGARFMHEDDGRQHPADLLRNIYDDDLDPSQNDTTIGAGVDRSLIQGDGYQMMTIGAGNGLSNTLANRSSFIYRPNPQLNDDDEPYGDFVRGDYNGTIQPTENADYIRDDFTPNSEGDAFLARLRRTHNPDGLDQVPGVSSSGDGLPLLIGNLAWFGATEPNARYSIRRDGVTVRATAIAQKRLAVRVWETSNPTFFQPSTYAVPWNDLTDFRQTSELTSVGEPVGVLSSTTAPTIPGYIAVYADVLGTDRVVGFLLNDPVNAGLQHNASPRLHDAWVFLGTLSDLERMRIKEVQNAPALLNELVKVPALVRSVP